MALKLSITHNLLIYHANDHFARVGVFFSHLRWNASHVGVFFIPLYLGQLVPELVEIGEDLGMDFGTADAIDVSQDTQNPPP